MNADFKFTLIARFATVQKKTPDTLADCVKSIFEDVGRTVNPTSHKGYHTAIREVWEHFLGETPKADAVNALIPDLMPANAKD